LEGLSRLALALERASRFIEDNLNSDGLWSDFLTLAGESAYWVSGYVGYALARCGGGRGEGWLEEVGSNILGHQAREGGWGYGPGVPADADSTSWCLLFLSRLGTQSQESRERALLFLLSHQSRLDGGFRTYAKPREIGRFMMLDESVSFEGWASSQTCVTAVAARALIETGSPRGVNEALDYLRRSQTEEGYWNPYWWSERLYATVNCMEALSARGGGDDAGSLSRAQDWIAMTQLADGGWSDQPTTGSLPFSTALAIGGLLLAPRPSFSDKIKDGVERLLASQLTDGSWRSHHILRIPHPSMKEPWKQPLWKPDGRAVNAAIKDHRRLYTTATALTALWEFEESLSRGVIG
jgi:Squalene-hopene cyclase C-terminal domain/Prenyltransferase and squalene oxidase repeat